MELITTEDEARAESMAAALFAEFMRPPAAVTVSQWADSHRMLSGKASSEPGPWRTDRTPYLRQIMDDLSARSSVQEVVVMFAAQLGKALDLETPIPTPTGWTTMGALQAGDLVFDDRGRPTQVVVASPVFHDRTCYRVVFSDGAEIVADAAHRWTVTDEADYRARKVVTLTTQEIAATYKFRANRNRYAIPCTGPLDLPAVELPIDPYALGVWLGDGNSMSAQFTQHEADAPHIIRRLADVGHTVVERGRRGNTLTFAIDMHGVRDGMCLRGHVIEEVGTYTVKKHGHVKQVCAECRRQAAMHAKYGKAIDPVTRPSFSARLQALNLIGNKHIPAAYLRASVAQRMELLRGLMDTDGFADASGKNCEITSSYPRLAADIIELIRSLGFKPTFTHRMPKRGNESCRIRFSAYADWPVFHLERKRQRLRPMSEGRSSETFRRRIVCVEPVPSRPVRCIAVEAESHLFLAGREMVATHNTESGMNWLGYIIDNEPGPVMVVQPTTDMAKRFSRQRIAPMLEETPALRRKVRENRSRDDANTTLLKDFAGGVLVVSGANSAASLRSMPVRYLFLDEIDAYPLDVDGEGDPVALAEKRTSTFARRKVLKVSTPTTKDFSRIEAAYLATNASRFFVPCPHCGEYQVLEWGANTPHGLRWDKLPDGTPDLSTVHYVCAYCGSAIEEHHKPAMLAAGEWRASKEAARPGRMTGYHLNALYAPLGWISWADLVAQWHEATQAAKQGDISKLKTFTNTVLAETWEEQGDKVAGHELARRAEDYPLGTVPHGGLLLTMGVDVQADRIEYRVWAWGRGQESWLVQREIIYGDPAIEEGLPGSVWTQLTERRRTPFLHAGGSQLMVAACAIDTGGHHTQSVYAYVRAHQHANVLAVKGSSTRGKAVLSRPTDVEVTWRGQRIPRGLKLWLVGTDVVKGLIYGRLRQSVPGPGYIHLPKALATTDEFDQLTAERLVTRYVKGHARMEWVKPNGRRNEALDCAVYAYAAAVWAGIERYTETQWRRLEDSVAPRVSDPPVAAPVAADLQAPDADAQSVASDAAAPESALQSAASDNNNTPALQTTPKPNPLFQRPARRPIQPTRVW